MRKSLFRLFFGTLRRQLITGVALVHAVMMSLFITDLMQRQQLMVISQQARMARAISETVAVSSNVWLASRDLVGLQEIINAQQRYPELIYAMVLDKNGMVLAHTDHHRLGQTVSDLPLLHEVRVLSQSSQLVDVVAPVFLNNSHIGWVRIGVGKNETHNELKNIIHDGILYALAAIILGSFTAALMGTRLTRRLHAIKDVFKTIESGNIKSRVQIDGSDEAAQLGLQFNNMLDKLKSRENDLALSNLALHDSKKQFSTLVHNIPGITYRCAADNNWSAEFISEETQVLTGYPASDFLQHNRHWSSIVHPEDLQRVTEAVDMGIKYHQPFEIEYRIIRSDNSIRWVFEKGQGVYDNTGAIKHLDGVIIDITDRKLAEEKLKSNELAWKSAMDSLDDVIYIIDQNRKLLRANSAFYNMVHGKPEEHIGKSIAEIIHPQGELTPCAVCKAQNELRDEKITMEKDDPNNPCGKPIEIEIRTLRNSANEVTGMLIILHDLTHDREQVALQLESERRSRAIIEASPLPLGLYDNEGTIIYLNPAFTRILGYNNYDLRTLRDWWHKAYPDPNYRQQVFSNWSKRMENSRQYETELDPVEVNIYTKYGTTRTMIVSSTPFKHRNSTLQMVIFHDITERVHAEKRLQDILNIIGEGIWDWNIQEKTVGHNMRWCELLGLNDAYLEHTFDTFTNLIHPDDRNDVMKRLNDGFKSGTYFSEHRMLHANGSIIWVSDRGAVIERDSLGNPIRALGSITNITDRKLAELKLRESEELFHNIADYTAGWENWINPQGKLLWVNPSVERITGYTVDECLAMQDFPMPMIAEEDKLRIKKEFLYSLQHNSGHTEFTLLRKDGIRRWMSVIWQPINDAKGKYIGQRSSVRDNTDIKNAEDEIRHLNTILEKRIEERSADLQAAQHDLIQFKTTLDQTLDCVFMFDPQTLYFNYVNRGAQLQVGYSENELFKMKPFDLKPEYTEAEFRQKIMHHVLSRPDHIYRFETVHRHKNGHLIPVEVTLQLVTLGDGNNRCIAIIRDISERRRIETLVEKRQRDLEAANRELEAFAYSVSHDLRAPLRAIDGFSRILSEDYSHKLDNPGLNYLQRIRKSVQRMGIMIDGLLELSRLGRSDLKPTDIDLSSIAHEIIKQLREENTKRHVDVVITENLSAHGDELLLRIVIQNLLDNAWKYTQSVNNAKIEFGSTIQNSEIVYFIRDNGVGFDMQFSGKLFGVFQRLHKAEEFSGTGVGLATVQRIIHRHGGKIWAESMPDKGACFYFTLPITGSRMKS